MRDGCDPDEVPSIFPVIREFDMRRAVRCRLPAQPPSLNRAEQAQDCATEWLRRCGKRVDRSRLLGSMRFPQLSLVYHAEGS